MAQDLICYVCNSKFASLDIPVKCDGFSLLSHSKCSKLTATELKCISLKNQCLKFFCDFCDQGLKEITELKTLIKKLLVEVESLKNSSCKSVESQGDDFIINEIHERNIRSHKPRPIKVTFSTTADVFDILKNKRKLSQLVPPSSVNVSTDRTQYQRNCMKKLRDELAARISNGETGLIIKADRVVKPNLSRGGGVLLAVNSNLNCTRIPVKNIPCIEQEFVSLKLNDSLSLLGCVYIPPNTHSDTYNEHCE
ncbi:MI domain-containing protein, partial [Aphis craccivora]